MEEVFDNRDLVRNLLSHTRDAVGVLHASKSIREAEECHGMYERWARLGCPRQPSDAEQSCLSGIGGLESDFCQGVFEVTTLDSTWPTTVDVPARSFAARVAAMVTPPTNVEGVHTGVVLTLGAVRVDLRIESTETALTVLTGGWRRKGGACRLTPAQTEAFLVAVLTRTGEVAVPCPETSHVRSPLRVPRAMGFRVTRKVDEQEWVLLHAKRR